MYLTSFDGFRLDGELYGNLVRAVLPGNFETWLTALFKDY